MAWRAYPGPLVGTPEPVDKHSDCDELCGLTCGLLLCPCGEELEFAGDQRIPSQAYYQCRGPKMWDEERQSWGREEGHRWTLVGDDWGWPELLKWEKGHLLPMDEWTSRDE